MNWLQKTAQSVWFRGRKVDSSEPHIRAQMEEHLNKEWRERILFYQQALAARQSGMEVNEWYRSTREGSDASWKQDWPELLKQFKFKLDDLRTCDVAQAIGWDPGGVY
jgi:hypothetical protein